MRGASYVLQYMKFMIKELSISVVFTLPTWIQFEKVNFDDIVESHLKMTCNLVLYCY